MDFINMVEMFCEIIVPLGAHVAYTVSYSPDTLYKLMFFFNVLILPLHFLQGRSRWQVPLRRWQVLEQTHAR